MWLWEGTQCWSKCFRHYLGNQWPLRQSILSERSRWSKVGTWCSTRSTIRKSRISLKKSKILKLNSIDIFFHVLTGPKIVWSSSIFQVINQFLQLFLASLTRNNFQRFSFLQSLHETFNQSVLTGLPDKPENNFRWQNVFQVNTKRRELQMNMISQFIDFLSFRFYVKSK